MRHSWHLVRFGTGWGMYGVELYAAVRLAVVEEGLSHHEAGRRFGIDRRTVKKMLSYSAPPGYRRRKPVRRPKLDGFTGIVDAILEADANPDVVKHAVLPPLPPPVIQPDQWVTAPIGTEPVRRSTAERLP